MTLEFWKMSGAGNDFVLVDNRRGALALTPEQIRHVCDRHFGVGGDGVLAVEPAGNGADFRMRYFNADGGEAEMCGNGARCFARFVQKIAGHAGERVRFETPAGVVSAEFDGELVEIQLTPPTDLQLNQTIELKSGPQIVHRVNTGVPHAVLVVPEVDVVPVLEWGSEIRHHADFAPKGTNVNFVQVVGPDSIRVRTYERGVEGETLACGTGVAASAIACHLAHEVAIPMRVGVEGRAVMEVRFRKSGSTMEDVRLKGPATFVFSGSIDL